MHFLFLQAGYSSLFNRVADELAGLGHRVTGINFCAGDQWLWRDKETINYRGTLEAWPKFVAGYLDSHEVTDLLLLGEQRDYHKQAVVAAQQRGIRVTVTDFGYLRPDWITLERDGMGGNSHFPRHPVLIHEYARDCPPLDHQVHYRDRFWDMARGDLTYSFANVLLWFLFPHYRRSDGRAGPLRYFPALGRRLLFAGRRGRKAQQTFERMLEQKRRYFLLPMQLDHDFQIRAYSPFHDVAEAIQRVLQSFARFAPADVCLLLKIHPWDPGFRNWRRLIGIWARAEDIEQRVVFLEGGDLEQMVRHSLGMVTVNSTSAITALQLGSPVVCLGQAIFDVEGLTFQRGLDRFWAAPAGPDPALVDAFLRLLAGTIQFRGVFYSEPGLSAAVREATGRLSGDIPWFNFE